MVSNAPYRPASNSQVESRFNFQYCSTFRWGRNSRSPGGESGNAPITSHAPFCSAAVADSAFITLRRWRRPAEPANADAAQQQPPAPRRLPPPTTKARTALPAMIVVTARRTDGETATRSGVHFGLQRARARAHPGAGHDRPAGRGSEPQHRPGPRLVQRDQHLHSRHRPARRAPDVRSGGRRLCRRRLSVRASAATSSTCSTSSASKFCAARRARSTARTRSAARSSS